MNKIQPFQDPTILEATIKLQSIVRMRSAQKKAEGLKKHVLSFTLFEKSKDYIQNPSKLSTALHPLNGITAQNIYLPTDLPIVIRSVNDLSRLSKMEEAQSICIKNNLNHLVIPKRRSQGLFIIEEKLPCGHVGVLAGMAFYFENRENYTPAVTELTTFLCKGFLSDLIGGKGLVENLRIAPQPRFDNLLLFEENGAFKIGIIDSEDFQILSPPTPKRKILFSLKQCIALFPYHLDNILEIGKKYCELDENDIILLNSFSSKSLQLYKILCEDYATFNKKTSWLPLTQARREKLTKSMSIFLMDLHKEGMERVKENYGWDKKYECFERHECFDTGASDKEKFGINCLQDSPELAIQLFQETLLPKMLDLIENEFQEKFKTIKNEHFIFESFTLDIFNKFRNDRECKELIDKIFKKNITLFLFKSIINRLVEEGEIYYYKFDIYGGRDCLLF